MQNSREVVITFQIASLGDTVVSLPAHREIARRHPRAERYLLTNYPIGKMVPAASILDSLGLISGTLEYPMPLRGLSNIYKLHQTIVRHRPDYLYYLTAETKTANLIRHYCFFRACGISRIRGVPWARGVRFPKETEKGILWESEASRLLRSIKAKSDPGSPPENDRLLNLTQAERRRATNALIQTPNLKQFVAISVGGKFSINDWGDAAWTDLLLKLSSRNPHLGAVFVGSADERKRNDELAKAWKGCSFNSCGLFAPRETAALLERACLFIGHDTGTLHLAAAVGTPVLGIFSARNVPGKWFSDRATDNFMYKKVDCMGCGLQDANECSFGRKCITGISPDEVLSVADGMLKSREALGPNCAMVSS